MIDILIPTYRRAERIVPLAENIAANSLCIHRLWFVIEADDRASERAAMEVFAGIIVNGNARSYAGAINAGYQLTQDFDWIFTGADDLAFHWGWDAAAMDCAIAHPEAQVIGTNDMINSYVRQGLHSTHSLVRRSYLDEVGGVIDQGPGSFMNEGYGHNYCDTELIATARHRGAFMPCLDSVVEHRHWSTGASSADGVTDKANATYGADAALYESRRHLWGGL